MHKQGFKTVLWDITPNKIDILPVDFVIQRVLSYGTISLIVEAIRDNGLATVKEIFEHMKTTSISQKKYNYLKKYLLV